MSSFKVVIDVHVLHNCFNIVNASDGSEVLQIALESMENFATHQVKGVMRLAKWKTIEYREDSGMLAIPGSSTWALRCVPCNKI